MAKIPAFCLPQDLPQIGLLQALKAATKGLKYSFLGGCMLDKANPALGTFSKI